MFCDDIDIRKKNGEELISILYKNFEKYFKSGDVIIGGSFLYRKWNLPGLNPEFKDIDIIIKRGGKGDEIAREIYNFLLNFLEHDDSFLECLEEIDGLIGVISFKNGMQIDFLRNDFRDNLSSIEILPGIITNCQSNEKLIEVYRNLSTKNKKFLILIDFYQKNSMAELIKKMRNSE